MSVVCIKPRRMDLIKHVIGQVVMIGWRVHPLEQFILQRRFVCQKSSISQTAALLLSADPAVATSAVYSHNPSDASANKTTIYCLLGNNHARTLLFRQLCSQTSSNSAEHNHRPVWLY